MHIVLDAMGGDNAPDVNIDGAIAALEKKKDLVISLTGPEALLREKLSEKRFDADRLLVVDAGHHQRRNAGHGGSQKAGFQYRRCHENGSRR